MKVTIELPAALRTCAGGLAALSVEASTPREALEQLGRIHPALLRSICDETGAVRRHIGLFINSTLVRGREAMDAKLAEGDVLTVMPAVSGG